MKKIIFTFIIWSALLVGMLELITLLQNIFVAVADTELESLQLPPRRNYVILLMLNTIIYLIAGIILRMRVKLTTTAGILALGLGVTYFTLVEMFYGSNYVYLVTHGSVFDEFLIRAFLLAPVVCITLGALVFSIWHHERSDHIDSELPNNSFKLARKDRGQDAAQ